MAADFNHFGSSRSKRKCEDSDAAAVLELLHSVSLSPSPSVKRLRQDFGFTSYANENPPDAWPFNRSDVGCPPDLELSELSKHNLPLFPGVHLPEELSEPLPACPSSNERALVLYKPVDPPLFPGGPSAGSQLKLSSTILSLGLLHPSSLLHKKTEERLPWLHPFSNGDRGPCDSETIEESAPHSGLADHLAVVPWVSHPPVNMLALQTGPKSASNKDPEMCGSCLDAEAMDDDSGLNMEPVKPSNTSNNSGLAKDVESSR